ncbi:MAG: dihydrolipoamide acyltransferase [Bacteroidales bacterium]
MIENIAVGMTYRVDLTVLEKDTAKSYKSGGLDVFATPGMIALMECAAFTLLKNEPVNVDSVGIEINVQHLRACLVGTNVWAIATVTLVSGNKIGFNIVAYDNKGEIGKGNHIRYIIDANKFISKLAK